MTKWLVFILVCLHSCFALTPQQQEAINMVRSETALKGQVLFALNKISQEDAILVTGRSDISHKNSDFIQEVFWDLICTGTLSIQNDEILKNRQGLENVQKTGTAFKGLIGDIYPPTSPELINAIFTRTLNDNTSLQKLSYFIQYLNNYAECLFKQKNCERFDLYGNLNKYELFKKQIESVWVYCNVIKIVSDEINKGTFILPKDLVNRIVELYKFDNAAPKTLDEKEIHELIKDKNLALSVTDIFKDIIKKKQYHFLHQEKNHKKILSYLNNMSPFDALTIIGNATFTNKNRQVFFQDIGINLLYTGKLSQQNQKLLGIESNFKGLKNQSYPADSFEREELIKLIISSETFNLYNPKILENYPEIAQSNDPLIKRQTKAIEVYSKLRAALLITPENQTQTLINKIHKAIENKEITKEYVEVLIKTPACIRAIEWFYNE